MQEIISIYSDKVNFVIYEIIEICSEDEKSKFKGLDSYSTTLYKARIEYDCLNDEPADKIIYLAKAGNSKLQPENQPLYNIGEKYAAMLMNLSFDSWNTALPELTFAVKEKNEKTCLYQIRFDFMSFVDINGKEIGDKINENEQYEYTTTKNNPVKYVRKFELDEIIGFLKDDWLNRKYTINRIDNEIFETSDYSYTDNGDVIPIS